MSRPRNVLSWLEESALRLPDKCAVADPTQELSWKELRDAARAAGSSIAHAGTARRAVALYLEKSAPALAAMLGALYAGDFYCAIDTRQPAVRVRSIIERLDPVMIVCDQSSQAELTQILEGTGLEPVLLDELLASATDVTLLAKRWDAQIDTDPAYVHFTSGSTGTPKGVITPHRAVLDFISCFVETLAIGEDEVLANQAPFDFDVAVKDIFSALATGATLRIVPREYFSVPAQLMDYLCESGVTSLTWAVSAMCFVSIMGGFDYRVPTSIQRVSFSGEVMPPKQLRIWQEALPHTRFINLYGPTEITCNCSYFEIDRAYADDEAIPMGKPFSNERIYLLDERNQLIVDPGIEGEICVAGTSVALGYLADPERTAEAFVPNPLEGRWTETIYRTGDIARYDEQGNLVYVSRKDNQIKLNGHRIELGDIEMAASSVDGVARACCLFDAKRKRLRLYYVGDIEKAALSKALHGLLPQFMVPNKIVALDTMPLNKNGKIDRAALAAL